ncbi:MAG: hypothetical protein JWN44_4950 [Myxococcales bacterium]|nr:hypothetical protein [Myxococcales bacterium]
MKDSALSYPRGGAAAIPRAFCDAVERFGGTMRTRAPAVAIERNPESGRWRVTLEDGAEIDARAAVATTGLRDVDERLVGAQHFPGRDRPSVRTPLPGLYVCGDGAGGRGIGTELACASAIECVDALAADGMLGSS